MITKKQFTFWFLSCFSVQLLYSQVEPEPLLQVPSYSVHSPEATSLGQYGDYKIDMATGVPNINIPLYVVKGSKLEFPISLSYHASGIKLDQESSFVGLGWTLNASGVVTRVLRDKADEGGSPGFITSGSTLPNYNGIDDVSGAGNFGNSMALVAAMGTDKEPDVFTISTNGLGGEFGLNNSGVFVPYDFEPNKIDVNFSLNLITIIDKKGTIYRFGRSVDNEESYETTSTVTSSIDLGHSNVNQHALPGYTSSWFLTEIISADNTDTIFFKYNSSSYSNSKPVNVTRYIADEAPHAYDGTKITSVNTSIINMRVLDKILFKGGSVQFLTASDRSDIQVSGKNRITGFLVYDKLDQLVNKVIFENANYFDRNINANPIDYTSISTQRKKSLKLDAVKFYDKDQAFINEYTFDYDPTPLAPRYTTAQDHWGFYNGKSNSSIMPLTFFTSASGKPHYIGEDRSSDFTYMKAASLQKITFPTGGYTQYEFEPNYYLTTTQTSGLIGQTKSVALFAINRDASCDPEYFAGIPASNSMSFTASETIANNGVDAGFMTIMFSDYHIYNGSPMEVKLTNQTTSQVYTFVHTAAEKDERKVISNTQFTVSQGHTYLLEVNTNGVTGSTTSMCNSPTIEVYLAYPYLASAEQEEIVPTQAGGLRVKSISNYTQNGELASKKIYTYGHQGYGPNNIGVGSLISDISLNFYNYPVLYTALPLKYLRNVLWFTSDSQVELGMNKGCPVDYEKITEKTVSVFDNSLSNGKTEYYYTKTAGQYDPKPGSKYPYISLVYPSWKQNNLSAIVYYKQDGNSFSRLKSIDYEYTEQPEHRIKTLKIIECQPDVYGGIYDFIQERWVHISSENPERFFFYNYYTSRGKNILTKETAKEYLNDVVTMTIEKNYQYNSNYDLQKTSIANSKGQLVETNIKYTAELDYATLISKNILSLPVQQETWVNSKVTGGAILSYNDFGEITERHQVSAAGSLTPVAYTAAASLPSYYEKREELIYDPSTRRIREVKGADGVHTVYLWSFFNQSVIATIVNADYATVADVLGSAAISGFSHHYPTAGEINSFLAPLRTDSRLNKAMITTYTYQPLVGVGSVTEPSGKTVSYHYDPAGRLNLIKDHDGNIIKKLEYKYQVNTQQ